MVDTVRTLAALQALLADNTSGDISAQDVRDLLLSTYAKWGDYTPTWVVSSGTNPSVGNGSITGRFIQHGTGTGTLVSASVRILLGSGASAGSGGYRITLPVSLGTPTGNFWTGSFLLIDSSDSNRPYPGICVAQQSGDWIFAQVANTAGGDNINWTSSTPITPASGDEIYMTISYAAA